MRTAGVDRNGVGEAHESQSRQVTDMTTRVLFLCTGNSARSILFAATLDHYGQGRFEAFSAGSQPAGFVHPDALFELQRRGISSEAARSKSWDEYSGPDAPRFDIVITVCDSAAAESCPVFFGNFTRVHWGLPDPAAVRGGDEAMREAFLRTEDVVIERVKALVALPVETLDVESLQRELSSIDARFPAQPFGAVA
jgi:arsenate reductase (thioredoxin)